MIKRMTHKDYAALPTLAHLRERGFRGRDFVGVTYRSRDGIPPFLMRKALCTGASGRPGATTHITRVELV
jgi:hypothetical protein